jgi:hypothetical protein
VEKLLSYVLEQETAAGAAPWAEKGGLFLLGLAVTWAFGRLRGWRRRPLVPLGRDAGQMIDLILRRPVVDVDKPCECGVHCVLKRFGRSRIYTGHNCEIDVTRDLNRKERARVYAAWRERMQHVAAVKEDRRKKDIHKALYG